MTKLLATPEDIRHAYRLLLNREPDEGGFKHYCVLAEKENLSPLAIAEQIMGSFEFRTVHGVLPQVGDEPPPENDVAALESRACTKAEIESSTFRYWAAKLHENPGGLHRKLWEWCFISQALHERGMLQGGRRGLGFAVGTEPLSSLFAKYGCSIVASDIGEDIARESGWITTNQHASGIAQLNQRGLCPSADFVQRVRFREVDMRTIPADLHGFDFLWSSCALEHLGSLQHGLDFVLNAMNCLNPGGIAVHTTELNCDSDENTIETGNSVIYRQRDLIALAGVLRAKGHYVEPLDFQLGDSDEDRYVDEHPYIGKTHIKLRIGPYASTSFGLIIRKSSEVAAH